MLRKKEQSANAGGEVMRENGKCRWRGNEGTELTIYGGEVATKQGT